MRRSRFTALLLSAVVMVVAVPSLVMAAENDKDVDGEEVIAGAEVGKYGDPSQEPSITTAPAKITSLTYNGKQQELITAGSAEHGTFYYKLSTESEWSTDVPSQRNAGTYSVDYYVKGDDGYEDTAVVTIDSIQIRKLGLQLVWRTGGYDLVDAVYDGSKLTRALPSNANDIFKTVTDCDDPADYDFLLDAENGGVGPDRGVYNNVPVTFAGSAKDNYVITSGSVVKVTITTKGFGKTTIDVSGVPTNVVYTGSPIVPELTVVDRQNSYVFKEDVDYELILTDNTDVGTAHMRVKNLNPNYDGYIDYTFEIVGQESPFLLKANVEGYRIYLDVYVLKEGIDDLEVTYAGDEPVMTDATVDGKAYKKFTVTSVAKEMADSRNLTIVADGTTVADQDLSVATYLKAIIASGNYSAYHNIAKALLHYGAAAQTYFGYNTGNMADEGVDPVAEPSSYPDEIYNRSQIDNALKTANPDIKYAGMTLTFESDLSLTLYFYSDTLTVDEVTAFVENNMLLNYSGGSEVCVNGDYVGIRVRNIGIKALYNSYQFKIYDISDPNNPVDISCGNVRPVHYIAGVIDKDPNSNISKLCKALWTVYEYADQ